MTFWTSGMMAASMGGGAALPVFVAASSAEMTSSNALTVDRPAGVVTGTFMIAFWFGAITGTAPTLSGWTLVYDGVSGGNTGVAIFTKIAGGSETASYSFSGGPTNARNAHILAYEGGAGLVDVAGTKNEANSTTATAASIAATQKGILISAFAIKGFGRTVSAAPSGMTQRSAPVGGAPAISTAVYDLSPSPAGATGAKTLTWSGSANDTAGVSIQIY